MAFTSYWLSFILKFRRGKARRRRIFLDHPPHYRSAIKLTSFLLDLRWKMQEFSPHRTIHPSMHFSILFHTAACFLYLQKSVVNSNWSHSSNVTRIHGSNIKYKKNILLLRYVIGENEKRKGKKGNFQPNFQSLAQRGETRFLFFFFFSSTSIPFRTFEEQKNRKFAPTDSSQRTSENRNDDGHRNDGNKTPPFPRFLP